MSAAPITDTRTTMSTTRGALLPYLKALATLLKGVRSVPLMRDFVVLDGTIGSLWATDYETTIGRCLDITGERVLIRLDDLLAAVKFGGTGKAALATPVQLLVTSLDNGRLVGSVKVGTLSVPVQVRSAEDYPDSAPLLGRGDTLCELDSSALQSMWKSTAFATAADRDMLPVLTAVQWKADRLTSRLEFVATDRYRAAFTDRMLWQVQQDATLLVPNRVGKFLPLLLPGVIASISTKDGAVVITDNATTIHQRLLDGDYPHVDRVIPTSWQGLHCVDRDALLAAAKGTLPFVSGSKPAIRLVFTGTDLTTQAKEEDGDWFDVGTVPASRGDNGRSAVGLNPNFLVDALNALDKGEVTIENNGPNKPVLFWTDRTRVLVMSVRIPEESK